MAKEDQNIQLIIVISGQPHTVQINVHERVENLVRKALNDSGDSGQPPSEWELRTVDGALIDQSLRVMDVGLKDGATLFLAPRAGVGG